MDSYGIFKYQNISIQQDGSRQVLYYSLFSDIHHKLGIFYIISNDGMGPPKYFNRMIYNEKNRKIFYSFTDIINANREDFFAIFMDRRDENKTKILLPQMLFMRHDIDNRYNYCHSLTDECLNVRIILTKIYSPTCINLYEVKFKNKLQDKEEEKKKIFGYETYNEQFTQNKTIYFNKYMKNKGKYIHNSTFAYILGYMDSTMILNKMKNKLIFTYMFRNYEDILLYIIQNNWMKNITKKLTIIQNFIPKLYYYEIKLDLCLYNIRQIKIIENKLNKKFDKSYSRINGYWCQNPIKTNPQVIDNGNDLFFVPDFTISSFLSLTILIIIISKYLLNS
ncbi:hypothetical protein HZS_4867 [Henneguya salminicola]|nr:hypothetical protein HZS_4867 [Henneguya salminicola]